MDPNFGDTTQRLSIDLAVAPKVLLVDDDELVIERLRGVVTGAGFEVDTAADGPTALSRLQGSFAPIVIMDRQMPGMDGLALCRAIRQHNWPGYVYILLLTVQDAEADILAGLDAGADDYVSKRSSTAQLLARLRTARRILALEHSLKNALEEKRRLSLTDALTGAPNRRHFLRHLSRELKRIQRNRGQLALMSLDIDHFKRINDRYGHAAGDAVLQEFVRRIGSCLQRETDWYARIGGEEFAVVLGDTSPADAGRVAEALRQAVAASAVQTAAGRIPVTVSIGVSGWQAGAGRPQASVESLLKESDQNLYASKQRGRNRVTLPAAAAGR
jgi:diguanylate cyclase (GGDEF)-like protein